MDKEKILDKALSLGLRAKWINDNLYVYSNYIDEWYVNEIDNKLVLHHKNLRGNSKISKHYHIQREYELNENEYSRILKQIKQHDKYKEVKNVRNKKMELFALIESDSIPKIKLN